MRALLIPVVTVALTGCAVSLQPFYTTATIFDDLSMEGRWTDHETIWQVTRTAPGHFDIATCESDSSNNIVCKADTSGVMFRTSGATFLDFQEKGESRLSSTIRPHGLFQIVPNGGGLDLILLDAEGIAKLAHDAHLDTDSAELESGVLLTAKPEHLQSFILRHLADPQVFGEAHHLERMADESQW